MKTLLITSFKAKSEGVILETNIPARLKPNRIPSKETFVSWDKIGKLLFEDYSELSGVSSRDSIRNNSSLKEEIEEQYCMPDGIDSKEDYEEYLKAIGRDKFVKKQIIDLLWKYSDDAYGKGSCGELGDVSKAVESYLFNELADDIYKLFNRQ